MRFLAQSHEPTRPFAESRHDHDSLFDDRRRQVEVLRFCPASALPISDEVAHTYTCVARPHPTITFLQQTSADVHESLGWTSPVGRSYSQRVSFSTPPILLFLQLSHALLERGVFPTLVYVVISDAFELALVTTITIRRLLTIPRQRDNPLPSSLVPHNCDLPGLSA